MADPYAHYRLATRIAVSGGGPSRKAREKAVAEWNAAHPVGTRVVVIRDSGDTEVTTTRSPATMLQGHSAVIWLVGIPGCYALTHVHALPPEGTPLSWEDAVPDAGLRSCEAPECDVVGVREEMVRLDDGTWLCGPHASEVFHG